MTAQVIENIQRIIGLGLNTVLPPRCAVTGEVVDIPGMVAPSAWTALRFISAPFCAICGYPFEFEAEADSLCGGCARERPLFATARAALVYDDASRGLILKFKHGDQTQIITAFTPLLRRAGREILTGADLLVPVPLHRWRLLRRRYNQAALLAQALSRVAGPPCIPDALIRRRATRSQGHMGFRARHRNVRGAFAINPRQALRIAGKNIVLIDDVYTSGATIRECTKALLKGGAASVHVLTVARVVKPDHYE